MRFKNGQLPKSLTKMHRTYSCFNYTPKFFKCKKFGRKWNAKWKNVLVKLSIRTWSTNCKQTLFVFCLTINIFSQIFICIYTWHLKNTIHDCSSFVRNRLAILEQNIPHLLFSLKWSYRGCGEYSLKILPLLFFPYVIYMYSNISQDVR